MNQSFKTSVFSCFFQKHLKHFSKIFSIGHAILRSLNPLPETFRSDRKTFVYENVGSAAEAQLSLKKGEK